MDTAEHEATRGGWKMPDLRTGEGLVPVVFFRSSGQFVALLPDETTVRAHTWDDLAALAEGKLAKARTRIAVEFIASDTGRRGTATGMHPRSHHPMVRWANGHTEAYQGNATPLRADTDTEELARLRAAADAAVLAVSRFLDDHRLSPTVASLVRHAIDKAAETVVSAEAPSAT